MKVICNKSNQCKETCDHKRSHERTEYCENECFFHIGAECIEVRYIAM